VCAQINHPIFSWYFEIERERERKNQDRIFPPKNLMSSKKFRDEIKIFCFAKMEGLLRLTSFDNANYGDRELRRLEALCYKYKYCWESKFNLNGHKIHFTLDPPPPASSSPKTMGECQYCRARYGDSAKGKAKYRFAVTGAAKLKKHVEGHWHDAAMFAYNRDNANHSEEGSRAAATNSGKRPREENNAPVETVPAVEVGKDKEEADVSSMEVVPSERPKKKTQIVVPDVVVDGDVIVIDEDDDNSQAPVNLNDNATTPMEEEEVIAVDNTSEPLSRSPEFLKDAMHAYAVKYLEELIDNDKDFLARVMGEVFSRRIK